MTWIYRLLLCLAIGLVYAPVVQFSFVDFDDQLVITENRWVQEGLTPESVSWAFSTLYFANWMPITWLTHLLDWELWKDWAGGHHLQSVLWHLAGVLLLFEGLRLASGRVGLSFIVAAIYALHPLHVESAVWIAERKGIVASAFALLTILLYVVYTQKPGPDRMALVAVSLLFGLMSKQMLVTIPIILLLLDRWPLDRLGNEKLSLWQAIVEKWSLFMLSAIFVPIAYVAQHEGEAISTWEGLPLEYRLMNVDVSLVTYLRRFIWPSDLIVFYPHPKETLSLWIVGLCLAILIGLTLAVIVWGRGRPWLAVGWIWFLLMILPVSGIVPIGSHGMADRYSDLPLIGITIALVWTGAEFARRGQVSDRWQMASVAAVLILLGVLSARQVQTWRDTETLFRHVLSVDPDNFMAHNELGAIAWQNKNPATAQKHFEDAINADPSFVLAHRNLGRLWESQGKVDDAVKQYREAGEWGDGVSWVAAAQLLANAGRREEALEACDYAIDRGERGTEIWTLRGYLLIGAKKLDEAESSLLNAISLDPNNARARQHLGVVSLQQGKLDTARLQFAWAASLNPQVADDVEKLVELSKGEDPILLDISAACLSEVEKFGVACRRIEAALILAAKQGRVDLVPGMQARLRAYVADRRYMEFALTQLPSK
jgi:tetratricopeptide (TPR) repeat protein